MYTILENNTMENGLFSDACKLDETLKYSGLYTDLCGMSMEDYIKAGRCCCNNDNSQGEGEIVPSKLSNLLTFTCNSEGFLMAYLDKSPTTEISVNCLCGDTPVEFILNDANIVISDVLTTPENIIVTDVTINPMEDDKYKYGDYTVVNKSTTKEDVVYTTTSLYKFNDIGNIKDVQNDDLVSYVVDEDGVIVSFVRPADTVFPENFYDEDFDYDAWVAENSFVPILLVDKNRFDNGELEIYVGTDDVTKYFVEIDTITIDGRTHSIIAKYTEDTSGIDQYLEYKGIKICTFSADGDINVKYTIK